MYSNEFQAIVEYRRSNRKFDPAVDIPEEVMQRCLERTVLSPNSSNMQLWEFHWIHNPQLLEEFVPLCLGQSAAKTAKELIVFVTRRDLYRKRARWNEAQILSHIGEREPQSILLGGIPCASWDTMTTWGGAFKIANSWKKNWGKSGFFWLRFKDLDMVRCAYSMFSNAVLDKNTANSLFKTRSLSISNETDGNLYLALGYDTPKGIQTKGWFRIEAGLSRNIDISQRLSNGIYYILMDEDGNVLEGKNKVKSLPLKNISFDLSVKNEGSEGSSSYLYSERLLSNKRTIQSVKVYHDNDELRLEAIR